MKRLVAALAAIVVVGACAPPARVATPDRAATVAYRAIPWNVGNTAKTPVRAVIDGGDEVVALAEGAVTVFADGALAATEARTNRWSAAATLPAPDRSGEWLVGIDDRGALFRLRARASFEPASARLGVEAAKVRAAVAVGGAESAFVTDTELLLSDGDRVRRYPLGEPVVALAGGSYVAVVVHPHTTTVVHTRPFAVQSYALDAVGAAVDGRGRVALATARGVYLADEGGDGLSLVYAGEAVHGLVRSNDRLYFADGNRLAVLDRHGVSFAGGVTVPGAASLFGSPSGDVWVLAGGVLQRYGEGASASASGPVTYEGAIAPLVARACTPCHADRGDTGIVLTNEAGLRARRDLLRQRVVVDRDMPPPSRPLSAADRDLVERWLANGAR